MNPDEIKKVAIYARVSSNQQREKRTIESQLSELQEYAKQHMDCRGHTSGTTC